MKSSKLPFPPFLPEDNDAIHDLTNNSGGGSEYGRAVTKLLNINLATLLKQTDTTFYNTFSTNTSLIKFLDTFLRYRSRTIDSLWINTSSTAAVIQSTMIDERKIKSLNNLDRRVLTTYFRLIINHATDPSLPEILHKKHIIDVPKLLDLCVLYGKSYPTQVRAIVEGCFKIQPSHVIELEQAWSFTITAIHKSLDVLKKTAGINETNNSNLDGGEKKQSKQKTGRKSQKQKNPRIVVNDVLKYLLDMMNTTISVIETVPTLFRDSCSERTSELLIAVALCSSQGLLHVESILMQLKEGIKDVEQNAIQVLRSLALRLAHAILNHCFLGPLETGYKEGSTTKNSNQHVKNQLATQETKNNSIDIDITTTPQTNKPSTSSLLYSVLNDLCYNTEMTEQRKLLQIHYNIAGRVQRLIDIRVLDMDAFSTLANVIFEDAPIPVSIMEEELEQESEIDVILREKQNATDARSQKLSHQAARKGKKGILHDEEWMKDETETFGKGRNGTGGSKADKKLREAMRAIMRKYDNDDNGGDDTLDSMTSSLRLRSDLSTYSDEEENDDGDDDGDEDGGANLEFLEVSDVNGISTGVVRDANGKRVEVLMPNMNRHVKPGAASRGRRRRGGGNHVDTRKCFNCGQAGHLSNECPNPRLTGSEMGKIKKAKREKKKMNQSKGVSGGGSGNAKGTSASNERTRKRNEKNKSSKANHNRKRGALKKAAKGM